MSNPWPQVFRGRGSVYALDEDTKQWADRGASGTVIMFQNAQNHQDVRIKWEKSQQEIWWRLTSSKLKPKGERALVLKAWATATNQQEILAIRFSHQEAAVQFAKKYADIFPMAIQDSQSIEKIFQTNPVSQHKNGNSHYLQPKNRNKHASMASLPGSILDNEDRHFAQFQPQYNGQNNGFTHNINNHLYEHRQSNPPPPPRNNNKRGLPHPRPQAHSQYVHNGQIVDPNLLNQQNKPLPVFKPMPDLDPLPAKPMISDSYHNGYNGSHNPKPKRMVKASPDMKPPMWNRPLPNNDPIELEYGHIHKKEWKCAVCTYQNQDAHLKCSMCGLPKKPGQKPAKSGKMEDEDDIYEDPNELGGGKGKKWQCPACTFSNHTWTDRCEVCKAKRRIGPAEPQNGLKLGNAKNKQEAMLLHRDISEQIKQDISSPVYNPIPQKKFVFDQLQGQSQPQPQLWSCPICTLSNRATNARCEACNTARNINPENNEFNLGLQENQVDAMMDHLVNQPEQSYQPSQPQLQHSSSFLDDRDDYQKMLDMSMGVSGNPYNINLQFDYNDPFNANHAYGDDMAALERTVDDFSRAASDIACYNNKPSSVFSTLRSVAKKLLKDDPRYRTLDTTNPKVMERLIGFEGVLDFLMLLGFESDAMGMKLICEQKPGYTVVNNAINVLNSYQQRFRMTDNGYGNGNGMGMDNEPMSPSNDVHTQGGFEDELENNENNENKNDILTLEQIILWSTHENMQDNDTMETLIMTHKMFTESLTLLKQLRKRFFVPIPPDILNGNNHGLNGVSKAEQIQQFQTGVQKRIQLKVIKALRDWMKHYWAEDFEQNRPMQLELQEWLRELSVYHELDIHNVNCVWIRKLYEAVQKECQRLSSIDWDRAMEAQLNPLSLFSDVEIGNVKMNTFLAKSTAEELADQITLMDYRLFSRIEPRECVHQRWKDANNKKLAPNILSLIQQFNNFTIFIQIQILRERSLKKRGTAIKRIIKMGQHFKLTRNYNSLCAVFSALNSAPIHRLKAAWSKVPERQSTNFKEWSVIFCRDFNHRNLRGLLRKAGGNPCIPHIGVFLQDLVFIDEGNKKKLAERNLNGKQMLNFNKCVRIADRIKNLQMFQHHKYDRNNRIHEHKKIQKVLLLEFEKLKDVTEDQIWDMSTEVRKQDTREAKQPLAFFGGGGNRQSVNQIPPVNPAQQ